ncbi:MAG: preprotein translocase subunit SecE [Liquorilactobacillus sp.]|uniref:preprotein translocase subunit SecE n=1 Tax=Liquorilactobacillus sp. TaxID=2767923 RepID=UPI0039E7399C
MKFIKSVFKTMKDTTWPTKNEAISDTTTVISTAVMFTIFFAIVDFLVQWVVSFIA